MGTPYLTRLHLQIEKKMQMVEEGKQLLADLIVLREERCGLEFELLELYRR
jgi:hypothetical protein